MNLSGEEQQAAAVEDDGHEEDRVHAVEHAAVAGEDLREILDAAVALLIWYLCMVSALVIAFSPEITACR